MVPSALSPAFVVSAASLPSSLSETGGRPLVTVRKRSSLFLSAVEAPLIQDSHPTSVPPGAGGKFPIQGIRCNLDLKK